MISHLSEATIKDYLESKIEADQLLEVDDHLAECNLCAEEVKSNLMEDAKAVRVIDIETFPAHLPFNVLESLVNNSIEPVEKEIAEVHLERCDACNESLNDLVALRKEIVGSTAVSQVVRTNTGFWKGICALVRPAYLVPALGLLLAGIFAVWWVASKNTLGVEQALVPTVNEVQPSTNGVTGAPSETIANANQQTGASQRRPIVASVNDGGTKIDLYSDGQISGLSSVQFAGRVRNALAKQEISIPADIREFSKGPGVLMGNGSEGVPFALTAPVAKVIESANPRFVWKPLAGTDMYQVEIFDEDFKRVASSLQLKTTSWQPPQPLRRGRVYRWQVTASKDGVEVKSPIRPAPDAKFKVIDSASATAIATAKRQGGSHLVLGIVYAEAGMLAEAEREFAVLLLANPDSAAVRSLLQKVRSAH